MYFYIKNELTNDIFDIKNGRPVLKKKNQKMKKKFNFFVAFNLLFIEIY
jgi:hypothetical protein